jgi:hypothetical protein
MAGSIPFRSPLQIAQTATPSTNPASGHNDLYAKSDGKFYTLDSSGVERPVSTGFTEVKAVSAFGAITLSGTQTIDGVALSVGDRCLVTKQSPTSGNGVYVVSAGAWTRATDAASASQLEGMRVHVTNGSLAGSQWKTNFQTFNTVGTDPLLFFQSQIEVYGILGYPTPTGTGHCLFDVTRNAYVVWDGSIWRTTNAVQWGTDAARLAATGIAGFVWFTTDTSKTWYYNGTSWVDTGYALDTAVVHNTGAESIGGVKTFTSSPVVPANSFPTYVRAATTANITLSGAQTVDGVALVAGDLCLVKNQSAPSTNGIYTVSAGAWSRTPGYDTSNGMAIAGIFQVRGGTANGGTQWMTNWIAANSINSAAMYWYQVGMGTTFGTTAPVNPLAGQNWFDPSDPSLKTYDPATSAWRTAMPSKTVRAVSTANITLSGTQTVDGVALAAGDWCLVTGQTTASANGIYVVQVGGWTRAFGYTTNVQIATFSSPIDVREGTTYGGTLWTTTFKATQTVDTDPMAWYQMVSAGAPGMPYAQYMAVNSTGVSGTSIASGGTVTATASFPAGKFSVPPLVEFWNTNFPSGSAFMIPHQSDTVTTTTARLVWVNTGPSATTFSGLTFVYKATQMTPTSAAG